MVEVSAPPSQDSYALAYRDPTREHCMNVREYSPPVMPAELRDILEHDARLEGMGTIAPGLPTDRRSLAPAEAPSPDDSGFVLLELSAEDAFGKYQWANEPRGVYLSLDVGKGLGFGRISERPVIHEARKRPKKRPDMLKFIAWHVVSPAFLEIVRKFDADGIESTPVDWEYRDGKAEYFFFDVTRQLGAYDYRRSALRVAGDRQQKWLDGLEYPRTLKPGIAPGVHIFRDDYERGDILVSRELARALVDGGMRGIRFNELSTGNTLELPHVEFGE